MSKIPRLPAVFLLLVSASSGCVRQGGELGLAITGPASLPAQQAPSSFADAGAFPPGATFDWEAPVEQGSDSSFSGAIVSIDALPSRDRQAPGSDPLASRSRSVAGADTAGDGARDQGPLTSGSARVAGTGPLGSSPARRSRDNTEAADLLDHWGHRRVQSLVEALSLGPALEADGADTDTPGTAAPTGAGGWLARNLEDGEAVRLLGARHGVIYGRWTRGPADTVSIEFDLSRAQSQIRDDPAFRALLERAGKAWSRRIADTWPTWERGSGDLKGWLFVDAESESRVWVGAEGEASARVEIDVKDSDLAEFAGRGGYSGYNAPGRPWETRFGTLQLDREFLEESGERDLFAVLVHEIGHVLGAWTTHGENAAGIEAHIDRVAGTWTGPNVVAVHGGPAPFQDAADPQTSVDGERSPHATGFDFAHSGVCSSIMAYCNHGEPQPAFLPHAIDFAFLADMGLTVTDEIDVPETYGLAGWTDHAGFSVSVSRDLQIDLSHEKFRRRRHARYPTALDVTDVLQAEVGVFGYSSVGDLLQSYPTEGLQGTVRYAGGLLGAATGRTGLPPVTGAARLAVNLGSLDGTAGFTSLEVHADGTPESFAGGSLHYRFDVSDNAILGSETGSTLRAGFYGPNHQDVAGTLHDPDVGLLAGFGGTYDDGTTGATRRIGTVPGRGIPTLEEHGPVAPALPVVEFRGDTRRASRIARAGADAAPALHELAARSGYRGVAVSSGWTRDGEGTDRVVEYLMQQIDTEHRFARYTPGLPTFREPPTVHLAEGTSEEFAAYVERAVQLINTALPVENRILLSPEPAPPLTALDDVPDGRILVDFAPSTDDWDLGDHSSRGLRDRNGARVMVTEIDPIAEYDHAAQRWEYTGMRAGRIWFDREALDANLATAWVRNRETDQWERELLVSRPVESDSVQHWYPDEYVPTMTAYGLLRALGILRNADGSEFPHSLVREDSYPFINHLPDIDGEALHAAYERLAPGTLPEDLSAESLGPWEDTSFHLRGDLDFAGGEASFGVALRNGLARPWAQGTAALAKLEDNTALFGTATWNGALLGTTPSAETVAGDALLTIELRTLDAALDFSGLERWGEEAAPGIAGLGTTWGDGDLQYSIEVDGNTFRRIGGDDGEIAGAFFGASHEAMGGVLERSDLTAGFGGVRQTSRSASIFTVEPNRETEFRQHPPPNWR